MKNAACISNKTEKGLKSFISNTQVVNHSILVEQYKKKSEKHVNHHRYVFLGVLSKRKNISLILEWLKNNLDAELSMCFIGNGECKNDVIAAKIHDTRIDYISWIEKDQIKVELCNYDFLILPSKEEPFGIVLLEALAAGVISIVSNSDGPTEIIQDEETGFIFDLGDEYNNFDAVMKKSLFLDEDKYKLMVKNCIIKSDCYSTQSVVEKWFELLNKSDEINNS